MTSIGRPGWRGKRDPAVGGRGDFALIGAVRAHQPDLLARFAVGCSLQKCDLRGIRRHGSEPTLVSELPRISAHNGYYPQAELSGRRGRPRKKPIGCRPDTNSSIEHHSLTIKSALHPWT